MSSPSDKSLSFGSRLEQLMLQRGSNPNKLGVAIKVHPSTIANYVTGKTTPRHDILDKISKYFDISLDWLTNGEGEIDVLAYSVSEPDLAYGSHVEDVMNPAIQIMKEARITGVISKGEADTVINYLEAGENVSKNYMSLKKEITDKLRKKK